MEMQAVKLKKIIQDAGLKCTRTRGHVLSVLYASRKPLSVDDISAELKHAINRVTLYRVLDDFVRTGLVYQTDFRTGKAYFEYQETHHHHIVCTLCGTRKHIDQCAPCIPKVAGFAHITHHMLEFFGVCTKCSGKA